MLRREHARVVGRLVLAALVAGCGVSAAAEDTIVLETIPGELRPVIEVRLNGQGPFRLFVDTGAGGNLISAELAERLGLEPIGRQRIFNPSTATAQEVDLVNVAELAAGALRLEVVPFVAANLPQLGEVHGVLGVRTLPPGLVTFDLAASSIRIEPGELAKDGPDVMPYETVPIASLTGQVEGHDLTFHLDTGSPDGITLPGALAGELAFDGELVTTRERGPLVVKTGRLRGTVRIGHLVLENPEVQVVDLFPDFGNIGSRFLKDLVLTMDREHGLLRLSKPPSDPESPRN